MATPAAVLSILVKADGIAHTSSQIKGLDNDLDRTGKRGHKSMAGLAKGAGLAGAAFGALAVVGIKKATDAFYESQKVAKQTNAVLKSTGEVAKISAKHVEDLATAISKKSGIDDEAIQSGENLLLTFTKIRNETGKGNKIFDRATQTITDMSVALGQDLKTTAIQVGKALQDPVKGAVALRRVGVSLTETQMEQIKGMTGVGKASENLKIVGAALTTQQKDQIKALGEGVDPLKVAAMMHLKLSDAQKEQLRGMNDGMGLMQAQKLVLRELTTEFGGSAAAQATSMDKLKVTLGNLQESIGSVFVPLLEKASGALNRFVDGMMSGTGAGGRLIEALRVAGQFLSTQFTAAIAVASEWVRKHRDDLVALEHAIRNVGVAIQWAWEKVALPVIQRTLPAIQKIVTGAFTVIGGAVDILVGILTLDFKRAWQGVEAIFKGSLKVIVGYVEAVTTPIRMAVKAIGGVLKDGFSSVWDGVKSIFEDAINAVLGFLATLARIIGKIPGVPDIDTSGWHVGGGGKGNPNIPVDKKARGGAFARTGGLVNSPITLMGEEAPRFPEYVIPTNPAYRGRAKGLLGQAASAIGMAAGGKFMSSSYGPPWGGIQGTGTTATGVDLHSNPHILGIAVDPSVIPLGSMVKVGPNPFNTNEPFKAFDTGGAIKGRRIDFYDWRGRASQNAWGMREVTAFLSGDKGSGGGILDDAASIISKFPKPSDLPEMFQGLGKYVIGKATSYVKDKIASFVTDQATGGVGLGGAFGTARGPDGVGTFNGVPMANWVIESLKYAQKQGVDVKPTSGYRPGFDPHTASGKSEHQGTQYPHGAVDFGGYNTGLGMKMAVVNATAGFKYPLLAPIGFHDDGHASGTGHATGGVFKYLGGFKHGGITSSEGLAHLHANEAVIPLKKGGPTHTVGSRPIKINAPKNVVAKRPKRPIGSPIGPISRIGMIGAPQYPSRRFPGPGGAAVAPQVDAGGGDEATEENTAAQEEANRLQEEANRLQEEAIAQQKIHDALIAEQNALTKKMAFLVETQGPQMIAATVAAVSGGIGGRVGLGFQSPSYSGGMARYR